MVWGSNEDRREGDSVQGDVECWGGSDNIQGTGRTTGVTVPEVMGTVTGVTMPEGSGRNRGVGSAWGDSH